MVPNSQFETELLTWAKDKVGKGLNILKKERAYLGAPEAMKFVEGEQTPLKSKALSKISDNRLRKIVLETVSSLTDVRQIWNYETYNQKFQPQAEILSKLARAWWTNVHVDRKLQSVLTYSCTSGSGYAYLKWDPRLPGGGDIDVLVLDPRDVIPIEPVYTDSVQDWQGIILRTQRSVEEIKREYPMKAAAIQPTSSGNWFGSAEAEGKGLYNVVSAVWDMLTSQYADRGKRNPELLDVMHIYVKDSSLNTGAEPITLGEPGNQYVVFPLGSNNPETGQPVTREEARLYPRGRYMCITPDVVLHDGPNPYWHGMFPVVKFTLDALPKTLLGAAMVADLIPLQNGLNEALRGLEDGMAQWIRRGVIADKSAIGRSQLEAIDTRKSGLKAYLNPGADKGLQVINGPEFPSWYMEMVEYFKNEMDELSGVRGLQQLAQLRQMPSADTIEKFMDALSPILRLRARAIEISLTEMAEMLKVNFFQFYKLPRRMQILGPEGATLEDFDYNPETMVPATTPGMDEVSRTEKHHKNFTFSIVPNSFLAVSHTTQKMINLQLFRANVLDPWTLWHSMDIPQIGPPPAETIPERIAEAKRQGYMPGPPPEVVQAQTQLTMMQAQQQAMMMQMQGMMSQLTAPQNGAPSNTGVGPEGGRPPSGGAPPQMLTKQGPEGPRTVISESGR